MRDIPAGLRCLFPVTYQVVSVFLKLICFIVQSSTCGAEFHKFFFSYTSQLLEKQKPPGQCWRHIFYHTDLCLCRGTTGSVLLSDWAKTVSETLTDDLPLLSHRGSQTGRSSLKTTCPPSLNGTSMMKRSPDPSAVRG